MTVIQMALPVKKYNYNLFKYSILISVLAFLFSCASVHNNFKDSPGGMVSALSADTRQKIEILRRDLTVLDDNVDPDEAKQLAETSICYSLYLADEYHLVRPPYLHNILIRLGIKDRGLCYQWEDDLMERLASLKLKSFTLHEGVAYRGSNLREHNTVVVTAKGQEFSRGIVLDPWRNSGVLFWGPVRDDKYPWEER